MNTRIEMSSRGRMRRRMLQAGWMIAFASVAFGFVALVVGSWQMWLAVTLLAGLAMLSVLLVPAVDESEVGNEGPAILLGLMEDQGQRPAA